MLAAQSCVANCCSHLLHSSSSTNTDLTLESSSSFPALESSSSFPAVEISISFPDAVQTDQHDPIFMFCHITHPGRLVVHCMVPENLICSMAFASFRMTRPRNRIWHHFFWFCVVFKTGRGGLPVSFVLAVPATNSLPSNPNSCSFTCIIDPCRILHLTRCGIGSGFLLNLKLC